MVKCKNCGKMIDPLEIFPNNLCVDCHEKKFNEELKKTGILPKPNFMRGLKY